MHLKAASLPHAKFFREFTSDEVYALQLGDARRAGRLGRRRSEVGLWPQRDEYLYQVSFRETRPPRLLLPSESMPMESIATSRVPASTAKLLASDSILPAINKSAVLRQCAAGLSATLLITLVGVALHANLATAGLFYLMLTVSIALHYGFWQASVISAAAIVCQSYVFAPPMFSFYIADPQNATSIIIFEVTALLVSRLAWREKVYARETELQRRRLDQLYAISRGALLLDPRSSPESQLVELIKEQCGVEAVAITDTGQDTLATAGQWPFPLTAIPDKLTRIIQHSEQRCAGFHKRHLQLADNRTGVLLVLGDLHPLSMDALCSLISLTLDRHRASARESVAEAARQAEQLRTAVLDGLAHAFKTPLTIIRAASSGLLETGRLDEFHSELAELVDEQSLRLDQLASQLLKTARLDGKNICLQKEDVSIPSLMHEVVQGFVAEWIDQEKGGDPPLIDVVSCDRDLSVVADHDLVAYTLNELLQNAAKYRDAGSKIQLSASEDEAGLTISVHNRGPAILLEDRERIFERFYRCAAHRHSAPGTGMGLSVARRVMEAHGGSIWVVSNAVEGTTFNFSLPMHAQARPRQSEREPACHCVS